MGPNMSACSLVCHTSATYNLVCLQRPWRNINPHMDDKLDM
jgi:hypothetical protein